MWQEKFLESAGSDSPPHAHEPPPFVKLLRDWMTNTTVNYQYDQYHENEYYQQQQQQQQQHPFLLRMDEMDSNHDGILTLEEVWNWTQRQHHHQQQQQQQQQHSANGDSVNDDSTMVQPGLFLWVLLQSLCVWLWSFLSLLGLWLWHWVQEWPLLDWKVGVLLWRWGTSSSGFLFSWGIWIWIYSILPGRYCHGWSSWMGKWPVLLVTSAVIAVELGMYGLIRFSIRLAETVVATPKHAQLRRAMRNATSYPEWRRYAQTLDISQNRHVWLSMQDEQQRQEREQFEQQLEQQLEQQQQQQQQQQLEQELDDADDETEPHDDTHDDNNDENDEDDNDNDDSIYSNHHNNPPKNHPKSSTSRTKSSSSSASASSPSSSSFFSLFFSEPSNGLDHDPNYNWRLITELMKELQQTRRPPQPRSQQHKNQNNASTMTTTTSTTAADIYPALAIVQQCTAQQARGGAGGILSADLFSYTNTGEPKPLVRDFFDQVVQTLHWMTQQTLLSLSMSLSSSVSNKPKEQQQQQHTTNHNHHHNQNQESSVPSVPRRDAALVLSVLRRARASHGRTALCLSGGAMMGLYHLGVVKALAEQGLLPRIISGTSAGSVIGALLCTRTNVELQQTLFHPSYVPTLHAHLNSFERPWKERFQSWYRTGAMFDAQEWQEKITWFTNGNMTFAEAFQRTGRIFCITLSSTSKKAPPVLLNYLTAPNVVIASAVLASSAVPGFIPAVRLQYKDDRSGTIHYGYYHHRHRYSTAAPPHAAAAAAGNSTTATATTAAPDQSPFHEKDAATQTTTTTKTKKETTTTTRFVNGGGDANPPLDADAAAQYDQTYYDGSIRQDIPIAGLAEALNCQFFIVSQCNPHIVPFFFNPKGGVGRPSRWSSGEQEHSWRGGFLLAALEMYLKTDMKSKLIFLKDLDASVGFASTMMTQDFVGSTTIVPQVSFQDYFKLFSDPSLEDVKRYFQRGQVAAYEHMELIKLHFSISDALEDCITRLERGINGDLDDVVVVDCKQNNQSRPDEILRGKHHHRRRRPPPPMPIRRREERCASFTEYSLSHRSSTSSSGGSHKNSLGGVGGETDRSSPPLPRRKKKHSTRARGFQIPPQEEEEEDGAVWLMETPKQRRVHRRHARDQSLSLGAGGGRLRPNASEWSRIGELVKQAIQVQNISGTTQRRRNVHPTSSSSSPQQQPCQQGYIAIGGKFLQDFKNYLRRPTEDFPNKNNDVSSSSLMMESSPILPPPRRTCLTSPVSSLASNDDSSDEDDDDEEYEDSDKKKNNNNIRQNGSKTHWRDWTLDNHTNDGGDDDDNDVALERLEQLITESIVVKKRKGANGVVMTLEELHFYDDNDFEPLY